MGIRVEVGGSVPNMASQIKSNQFMQRLEQAIEEHLEEFRDGAGSPYKINSSIHSGTLITFELERRRNRKKPIDGEEHREILDRLTSIAGKALNQVMQEFM